MDENKNAAAEVEVPVDPANDMGEAPSVEEDAKPVGAATVVDMDAVDPFPPHDENIASQ